MARLIPAVMTFITLMVAPAGATPQARPAYGPVVGAYLAGLAEELNELDFQLRHREISRRDYERARQRLITLRRFVERQAARSREDLIPEFQVLTADEFGTLALSAKPDAGTLRIGAVLDGRWKLIATERRGARFFIFERVAGRESASDEQPTPYQASKAVPNFEEVIETVVVDERAAHRSADPSPRRNVLGRSEETSPPADQEVSPLPPRAAETTGPRISSFYLPAYTPGARGRRVEGEVILSALFQRDGKIKEVVVERGLGYGLNERAVQAARRITFEPARQGGRPVDRRAQLVFTFRLDQVTAQVRAFEPVEGTKRSSR